MRNFYLDEQTARDINARSDRILRELGNPQEVKLAEIRELLKLDLHYYTTDDPGFLQEITHKLKVGAKQIIKRPSILIDVVKKFDLKALFVPDKKRILIDSSLPDLKKRWSESHEISHSLIPWHADYMLGDNKTTLSPSCHEAIEAEANYCAGRLLFPAHSFNSYFQASTLSIDHIRSIAKAFGNTITTTFWRCIESSDELVFGTTGQHPRYTEVGKPDVEYFIRSKQFEIKFSNVTEQEIFEAMKSYCNYRKTGPLGSGEIVLADETGNLHVFLAETFSIKHYVLTLARYKGQYSKIFAAHPPIQIA